MPLRVVRRKDTGALTIVGTLKFPDGSRVTVRRRAQTDEPALAEEEAIALAASLLRDAWHGERRGARPFAAAVTSYLKAKPRPQGDKDRLNRILRALGDVPLSAVDQAAVNRIAGKLLRPGAKPATLTRSIIIPLRAVMRHAHKQGWCDAPVFEVPRKTPGRTLCLLPTEAVRLVAAAAPHIRPLLIFLLCTGARMSEAIELEWRDVDLAGGRAIFWLTKGRERRVATLPPAAIIALAGIKGDREGRVFRWRTTEPKNPKKAKPRVLDYADRGRESGGHIRTAWAGAIVRAGLDPALTPHALRHTWASWLYAAGRPPSIEPRDLLAIKAEGGWSSVTLVERYAHLLPAGQEAGIHAFWGLPAAAESTAAKAGGATA